MYICNFHVLSNLLLIYICKLHWNPTRPEKDFSNPVNRGVDMRRLMEDDDDTVNSF